MHIQGMKLFYMPMQGQLRFPEGLPGLDPAHQTEVGMANAITDDTPNMIGQLMDGGVQVSIEKTFSGACSLMLIRRRF
jgi:hypothetical protein